MGYNYFGNKHRVTKSRQKPQRKDLDGMSPSEFKTFLKKNVFRVRRDFFKMGSVATKGSRFNHLHRLEAAGDRWWPYLGGVYFFRRLNGCAVCV